MDKNVFFFSIVDFLLVFRVVVLRVVILDSVSKTGYIN